MSVELDGAASVGAALRGFRGTGAAAHRLQRRARAVAREFELSVARGKFRGRLSRSLDVDWVDIICPGTAGSSALRIPLPLLPKSPYVGEERRAWSGSNPLLSPTGSPSVGSRASPYRTILWSTITSLRARHVRLERRVIFLPYVVFTRRDRDEPLPRGANTAPLHRALDQHHDFSGLVVSQKTTVDSP